MTDMEHVDWLQPVADEDVKHLFEKEKTYKGSWKRRGGVGAFMMLARKWDRIEGFMESPEFNYDVFRGVETDPSGRDGTVIAEVRDLRRYLLLVEAEMVARGVLAYVKTEEPDSPATMSLTQRAEALRNLEDAAKTMGNIARAPNTVDDDGKQHSTLTPWMVSTQWRTKKKLGPGAIRAPLFDLWWRNIGPGVWAMEANVIGPTSIPTEIDGLYEPFEHGWTVKIADCPPDAREHFPRLLLEVNHKELTIQPMWQQDLYDWNEGAGKYVLREKAWHVEG